MANNAGIKVLVTRKIRDVPPNFDSRLDRASSESYLCVTAYYNPLSAVCWTAVYIGPIMDNQLCEMIGVGRPTASQAVSEQSLRS